MGNQRGLRAGSCRTLLVSRTKVCVVSIELLDHPLRKRLGQTVEYRGVVVHARVVDLSILMEDGAPDSRHHGLRDVATKRGRGRC